MYSSLVIPPFPTSSISGSANQQQSHTPLIINILKHISSLAWNTIPATRPCMLSVEFVHVCIGEHTVQVKKKTFRDSWVNMWPSFFLFFFFFYLSQLSLMSIVVLQLLPSGDPQRAGCMSPLISNQFISLNSSRETESTQWKGTWLIPFT